MDSGTPIIGTKKTAAKKGINLTDGKGPNLELGGIPYDYIPSFLLLDK